MLTCDPKVLPGQATCFHCIGPEEKQVLNLFLLNQIAGTGKTAAQLAAPSAQFRPFNAKMALAAKAYLLAVASGSSTDPKVLVPLAKCWPCIPKASRLDVENLLEANNAGGSVVPTTLVKNIGSYRGLYPMRRQVELYLLSQIAGVTSPVTISANSKCFRCLDRTELDAVILFLECVGFGTNLIPPGSRYGPGTGAGPEFDLAVRANQCYQICWGANDLSVTLPVSGQTLQSTGAGTCSTVFTFSDTLMQFFGTFAGTTVTVFVSTCPGTVPPIPTGFTWAVSGANLVANWNPPPSGVVSTQLFTSTDGVNYVLQATVPAPGTTASMVNPLTGVVFAKIRFVGTLKIGPFTLPLQAGSSLLSGLLSYWKFDDVSVNSRTDTVGSNTLTDANNNLGNTAGLIGNALKITSGAPTFLTHADNASLRISTGGSKTFSLWFQAVAQAANEGILAKSTANSDYLLWIDTTPNMTWQVRDGGGVVRTLQVHAGIPAAGAWHHIVVGYDDANSRIFAFYDNVSQGTTPCVGATASVDPFTIGTYFNSTFNDPAFYDETGMWNRVLTAAEVNTLFNAGAGKTYPFN